MLEILFLIWFYRMLAEIAEQKGRSRGWGMLGVACWIGGGFAGALCVAPGAQDFAVLYGSALLGAVVGAILAYLIVRSLEPSVSDVERSVVHIL